MLLCVAVHCRVCVVTPSSELIEASCPGHVAFGLTPKLDVLLLLCAVTQSSEFFEARCPRHLAFGLTPKLDSLRNIHLHQFPCQMSIGHRP